MRAFVVAWRAIVSLYNDLFLLMGMSLLWWVTGGIFVAAAVVLGVPLALAGGPYWLAPLLAIPAGPATAALAHMTRRIAREEHVDGSYYWEGFRLYWRQALALNAVCMVLMSALLLNLLFYSSLTSSLLAALSILWVYLILFFSCAQLWLFPLLVALTEPTVWRALRMAVMMSFANPIFSVLLLALAAVLTGVSIILAILVVMVWPALMALLGNLAVKLFVERAAEKSAGKS